jgi:hypothetical protein
MTPMPGPPAGQQTNIQAPGTIYHPPTGMYLTPEQIMAYQQYMAMSGGQPQPALNPTALPPSSSGGGVY